MCRGGLTSRQDTDLERIDSVELEDFVLLNRQVNRSHAGHGVCDSKIAQRRGPIDRDVVLARRKIGSNPVEAVRGNGALVEADVATGCRGAEAPKHAEQVAADLNKARVVSDRVCRGESGVVLAARR